MRTKRSHEGYFQIDHHDAPAGGIVGAGENFEAGAYRCPHCHRVVIRSPRRLAAGYSPPWCAKCDEYICYSPECRECNGGLNRVLDKMQEAASKGIRLSPGGIILP